MGYPQFEKLVQVVKALRDPENGCPWDLKQTHQSLVKYMIEEGHEFAHAAEGGSVEEMEEELGDMLLQILLHATIAEETKKFTLESVSDKLRQKLIRRHPHVFDRPQPDIDVSDVVDNWEKIKREEKAAKPGDEESSLIDEGLLNLPGLFSAYKIGKRTAKVHFDWDEPSQVVYKVEEKWQELKEELAPGVRPDQGRIEEEIGDFLFSVAQLARHLNVDPESAIRSANRKFLGRFKKMEKLIQQDHQDIQQMNQKEMDVYWDKVKQSER